jgi:hypothetical protein
MPRKAQSNPPKRRLKGRSGGLAGGAGYDFQDIYVAGYLARILAGDHWDAPVEVIWEKHDLDTGAGNVERVDVDDAIIRLANGRWVFAQVKQSGPRGGWSVEELARAGVAQQLWNQWSSRSENERIKTIVRFATAGDCQRLRVLVDVAARSRTPAELLSDDAAVAKDVRSLAATLGLDPNSAELLTFLKSVHIEALPGAEELEERITERLISFGAKAADLKRRLIRMVALSKHLGLAARSAHTRESLVQALLEDGLPKETLMIAGLVKTNASHDAIFWNHFRSSVVTQFSKLRVYGLEISDEVYADLPSLVVPLKLVPLSREAAAKRDESRTVHEQRSIEEMLVGEDRPTDENIEETKPDDAEGIFESANAFTKYRRIGLIGGPGAGKTTMLKWWAIIAAASDTKGASLRQRLGLSSEPLVPLYVRFRDFARWVQSSGMDGMEGRFGLVANFVAATFQRDFGQRCPSRPDALAVAEELLRSEATLFLFDGLDEVPDEKLRQRLFDAVADLLKNFKEPRVILSTRPYAITQDRLPADLSLFEPLPLDRIGRRTFATRWYRAITSQVRTALSDHEATRRAKDLADTAEKLRDIAENPLLMSILALIHFNRNGLAVERAKLYEHATMAMLGHWDRSPLGRDLGEDAIPPDWAQKLQLNEIQIHIAVQCLAYHVQFQEGGSEFPRSTALQVLRDSVNASSGSAASGTRAELLLRLLVERSGLILERSPEIFAFTHLSFQEYLAGKRLLTRETGVEVIAAAADEDKHAEVVRFAVGLLTLDDGKTQAECTRRLFQAIADKNPTLAAACLLDAPNMTLEPAPAEQLARRVYNECSGRGRHFHRPRYLSRVVWTVLRFCSNSDRLVLEFLASGEEGHRGPMEFEGPMGILVRRPVAPVPGDLRWVLERIAEVEPRHDDGLQGIARLILAESGHTPPSAHIAHLIKLLGQGREGYLDDYFGGRVTDRVESLLRRLLNDAATGESTRRAMLDAIEEPERGYDESRRAWASIEFLMSAESPPHQEIVTGLVRHGLSSDRTKAKAAQRIRNLLATPASELMARALIAGLSDSNANVSLQSAALIAETGIALSTADQVTYRDATLRTMLAMLEGRRERADADRWPLQESIIQAMLTDPATREQTTAALAEKVWSKNAEVKWFAAKWLVVTGTPQVPGVLEVLLNIGLNSDAWRPEASRHLSDLRKHPILCHATRAAIIEGLQGRTDRVAQELRRKESGTRATDPFKSEDDAVATACAILILESGEPIPNSLLSEVIPAALRHGGQAPASRDYIIRLLGTEQGPKVLESIAQFFGSGSITAAVASVLAKSLVEAGHTEIPNLSRGLVLGGLSERGDHDVVLEHVGRMLDDPRLVTGARKALAEGISSQDSNVAWGALRCLCEKTERTDEGIPGALIRIGLTSEANKEKAREWLRQLLLNPYSSQNAIDTAEEGHRTPGLAWEIARCFILARKFDSKIFPEFIVLGGLTERQWHADVTARLIPVLQEGGEFADKLRARLWKALAPSEKETNRPQDVSWGAARLLIEAQPTMFSDSHRASTVANAEGDQSDVVPLLRVVARESTREPIASEFLKQFAGTATANGANRRALVKTLDDESHEVAFAAARCLFELGDIEHLSLPVALVRGGFSEEERSQEALRMLTALRHRPEMAQAVRSALILGMWEKDAATSWTAAAYAMDNGHRELPGIARGLVFGRRFEWRDGGWETAERLELLLSDSDTRPQTIDAIYAGLYEEDHSHRFDLIGFLVRAGAPLYDKILSRMADASRWGMPAAPLAILALSGRIKEAREAAERLQFQEIVELIGTADEFGAVAG